MRPYVRLSRYLDIWVPEFENDLWLPRWETLCIRNASAQDECVFAQSEVLGINEQNFPDLERRVLETFRGKFHAALIGRRPKWRCA
jgi:hypothetical protein